MLFCLSLPRQRIASRCRTSSPCCHIIYQTLFHLCTDQSLRRSLSFALQSSFCSFQCCSSSHFLCTSIYLLRRKLTFPSCCLFFLFRVHFQLCDFSRLHSDVLHIFCTTTITVILSTFNACVVLLSTPQLLHRYRFTLLTLFSQYRPTLSFTRHHPYRRLYRPFSSSVSCMYCVHSYIRRVE